MTRFRPALFAGLSVAALAAATSAFAQEAAAPPQDDAVEAIVVTGIRAAPRARLDTVAPVDVIQATQITRAGNTELAQALSAALPSLNFTRPAVTDGTDTVRPVTLRGLSPDQTLVLLNSKRAHASSLVNLNGAIGYGAASVDLNTIPTAAIGTVEVLRDGASAQYGSDAIAGVVNLRLREARSGGNVSVTVGQRDTTVNYNLGGAPRPVTGLNLPTKRDLSDGATTTVSGWTGLPLGADGFLTVSAESKVSSHTTRAGPDPRQQYPLVNGAFDAREFTYDRFNNWYGDPQQEQYTGYLNAGYDLSPTTHLYAFGGYQHRDSISAANVRRAFQQTSNPASNLLAAYPDGFLPKIEGKVSDINSGAGIKFKTGEWNWDASLTYGQNRFKFGVIDSLNVSLGPTSPKTFNAGGPKYEQGTANLDVTRPLNIGGLSSVNLSAGGEVRYEKYQIFPGQPESYANGGYVIPAGQPGAGNIGGRGTQGFPGFQDVNAANEDRTSESAYIDLSSKLTEAFEIDAAGRYEHYSDFGSVWTGKLAARYDINKAFALRGAISRGFRAPSLQQQFVSYNQIVFVGGDQINNTVIQANSPVAALIGAVPLKPEKSMNYSAGAVFRSGPFSMTFDAYLIRINNRIALTDALTQANVLALFPPSAQIGGVKFFTNGLDTTTSGQDLVAAYRWNPESIGNFNFSASVSHNETHIRTIRQTPQLSALNPPPAFQSAYRIESLTKGQPKWKGSLVSDWSRGWAGLTAKATYYGSLLQPNNTSVTSGDYRLGAKTLVDLEGRVTLDNGVQFALGAENIFDTYPTTPPYVLNGQTLSTNGVGQFPLYSPFGFQGRFVYARIGYSW